MQTIDLTNQQITDILTIYDENLNQYYTPDINVGFDKILVNDVEVVNTSNVTPSILITSPLPIQKNVYFDNVQFKIPLYFGSILFEKNLTFKDCVFDESINFGISIFSTNNQQYRNVHSIDTLTFISCTFSRKIHIINTSIKKLYFKNCNFLSYDKDIIGLNDSVYIQGGMFDHIAFLGGIVEDNIHINGGIFNDTIYFGNRITVKSQITISRGLILNKLEVSDANIEEILIRHVDKMYIPFLIIGGNVKKLNITPTISHYQTTNRRLTIRNIIFKSSPDSVVVSENCLLINCVFAKYNSSSNSTISFNSVEIEKLSFVNFNNYGRIIFTDLKPRKKKSVVECESSNLGSIDFVLCNLSNYNLKIDNTKLINIFYTSTSFPKDISSKKNGVDRVKQLRDTYDQLQTVAIKQGDKVAAIKWQERSLNYYHSSLSFKERKWWILSLMKISNNFRMSSSRSVLFTSSLGLIIFITYILSYIGEHFCQLFSNTEIIENYSQYFFEFLNPTHRVNFIGGQSCNPTTTGFLDLLGRIIVGFGIYQTIQAFRRYGKGE